MLRHLNIDLNTVHFLVSMVSAQLKDMLFFYLKIFLSVASFGCKGLQGGGGEKGHKEDGRGDKTD